VAHPKSHRWPELKLGSRLSLWDSGSPCLEIWPWSACCELFWKEEWSFHRLGVPGLALQGRLNVSKSLRC
jgi:hypothetical protein